MKDLRVGGWILGMD